MALDTLTQTGESASKIAQVPLLYQENIGEHTRLALWKIEEEEAFFSATVPVHRPIAHPHKRLQHLAGRYLLTHLYPGFPSALILIAGTRKPFLEGQPYQFSISHAGDYAACIVSTCCNAGIDVELASEKVTAIRRKFLSQHDAQALCPGSNEPAPGMTELTIAWSTKEAVYKGYGKGEVDFKRDIVLEAHSRQGDTGIMECTFGKPAARQIRVYYRLFGHLVLAWIAEPV